MKEEDNDAQYVALVDVEQFTSDNHGELFVERLK